MPPSRARDRSRRIAIARLNPCADRDDRYREHVLVSCESCASAARELTKLRAENDELKAQLRELDKLCTLQAADLERFRVACQRLKPNEPEHAPREQLQLVFEQVLASLAKPANDAPDDETAAPEDAPEPEPKAPPNPKEKKQAGHGRRDDLDLENLSVERVVVDPPEVVAAGGNGYARIGEETADRIAFRPASHFVLRIVTTKWVKLEPGTPRRIVAAETPPSEHLAAAVLRVVTPPPRPLARGLC